MDSQCACVPLYKNRWKALVRIAPNISNLILPETVVVVVIVDRLHRINQKKKKERKKTKRRRNENSSFTSESK